MRFILRGRRSIWWGWRLTLYPPRILNDVSYVRRINHAVHFAWQAQYLARFEVDFASSAHSKWRFICDADQSWVRRYGQLTCSWLLPSRIRPTSWKNVVNQFEIIWISRLGLLSFGPAIAGSLLESIFIDSSLDPAIVGSVLLSMCIACIYTIIYVYITLSKTRYTYHIKSQSIRSTHTIMHLHFLSR